MYNLSQMASRQRKNNNVSMRYINPYFMFYFSHDEYDVTSLARQAMLFNLVVDLISQPLRYLNLICLRRFVFKR